MRWWKAKNATQAQAFKKFATHDLHYHYDGSISPDVVRIAFPDPTTAKYAEQRAQLTQLQSPVSTPEDFFSIFKKVFRIFEIKEDITAILAAQFDVAVSEGLRHIDYRFGCGALSSQFGLSEGAMLARFRNAFSHAQKIGLDVCPTLCFSRHESMQRAYLLRDFVLKNKGTIRAIDLEGPESPNETAAFGSIFRELKSAGRRVTVHAGEFAPPKSIWQAIEACGAERLGHAYAAAEDAELLRRLAKDQVAIEVCLTSNYLTGVCKDLNHHPFLQFLEAGVPVVLCTDDKAIFKTTLAQEYEKADMILKEAGQKSAKVLKEISKNSRRFAFSESQS